MEISKVTPITTIKLCRGVKTDPSYSDVLTHANRTTQFNYYSKKAKKTCTNAVPVRNNVMRVPYCYDDIYDCNYVMWQNANFTDKWFYGFIRSMSWVNINVTEIKIEMDVWETWQFDLTFKTCFVERMHVSDDKIGKYKAPEPFDVSNKLMRLVDTTSYGTSYKIAIFYVPDYDFEPALGYRGLTHFCVDRVVAPGDVVNAFNEYLKPLIDEGLQDNIIGAVMVPSFVTSIGKHTYNKTLDRRRFHDLDGYHPANNKLLTFPYNSLRVSTQNGLQGEYWFEEFEDNNMQFVVCGCASLDMMLYGDFENYLRTHSTRDSIPNQPYTNVVSGFPQCMLTGIQSLGYAQAASALAMQAVAGVKEFSSTIVQGLSGQNSGRGNNLINKLMNTPGARVISEFKNESMIGQAATKTLETLGNAIGGITEAKLNDVNREAQPDYAHITSLPSSTTGWAVFDGEFQFLHSYIDAERAERYDTYLTRWGYSIQGIAAPQLKTREVFNYVKTRDCNCFGNIYMPDLLSIRKMFDDGVTLWHEERGYEPGDWGGSAHGNKVVG